MLHIYDERALRKRRVVLALSLPTMAVAVLGVLGLLQEPSSWPLVGVFALASAALSFRTIDINDRLTGSPAAMIVLTAVVIFGPRSGVLAAALIGAAGFLLFEDLTQRRWFQPAVNFGQLVLSAVAGAAVLSLFLLGAGNYEDGTWMLEPQRLWLVAVGSVVAATVYTAVNVGLVRFIVTRGFPKHKVAPWSRMLEAVLLPSVVQGFLGGMLGATYVLVGPAMLPLILIVFYIGYMAFESYAMLRAAKIGTLKAFVKTLEAKDLYTRGHTERVAEYAEMIGEALDFDGTRLEVLRWAALIHDLGKLAVPRDLIRKKGRLTPEEYEVMKQHVHIVEDLLANVDFLAPVVAIAAAHHAHYDGNGYHGNAHNPGETPSKEACILAVADSFDAMTTTRSYRVALSQAYAFMELRRHAGTQFDPEIVEAFIDLLERRGLRYGSSVELTEEEARKMAEVGPSPLDPTHGPDFPLAAREPDTASSATDGQASEFGDGGDLRKEPVGG